MMRSISGFVGSEEYDNLYCRGRYYVYDGEKIVPFSMEVLVDTITNRLVDRFGKDVAEHGYTERIALELEYLDAVWAVIDELEYEVLGEIEGSEEI